MNNLDALKKLSLQEVEQKIEATHKEIKTTRAITYVFDVLILMVAGLYIFDVNFSKWLMKHRPLLAGSPFQGCSEKANIV